MVEDPIKEFILKNSSDSRLYGLFYKEKQLLEQNDLIDFAQYQLKKNKNLFLGSFGFFPILLFQVGVQFAEYIETGSMFAFSISLIGLVFCFGGLFFTTKEYYAIKSSMNLLIAILEEESQVIESSNSAAILSKA